MPDFVKINDSPASKEKKRCFFGHHEPNVIRKVTREKKTMSILDLVFFKNRIRKSSKCVYLFTSHTSKQLTSHWNLSLCVYESECECECVGLSVYGHWTTRVELCVSPSSFSKFFLTSYLPSSASLFMLMLFVVVAIVMLFFRIQRNAKLNIVRFIISKPFFIIFLFEESFNLNLFNVFTENVCVCVCVTKKQFSTRHYLV